MNKIQANELKTKGVSTLEENLISEPEAVITVHGHERFVVMKVDHYQYLREKELEAALFESCEDIANGDYVTETPEKHINRISPK